MTDLINGVVIPNPLAEVEPPPLTGDDAVALIRQIHNVGLSKGYRRVRLDRGQHPDSGDYYEAGYVHGEVTVRYSHHERRLFRRMDPLAAVKVAQDLAANARRAFEEATA